jgi:hypothetical protein
LWLVAEVPARGEFWSFYFVVEALTSRDVKLKTPSGVEALYVYTGDATVIPGDG